MTPTELLQQLVQCPSVNPMGADADLTICYETRINDLIRSLLESRSIAYESVEIAPDRHNLVAWSEGSSERTIWLDAHTDTVPIEGMTVPPFAADIHDGRLYGRGACDVKGGLAAMLHAFLKVASDRSSSPATVSGPTIVLSCTCDEEHDTMGIDSLVETWAGECDDTIWKRTPDECVVAEPTSLDVVVAHRGVVRWKIRTSGRACHSSEPGNGVSAIYRMAEVISALEKYAKWLASEVPADPLCGQPSFSVGRVMGGQSINIVPDACEIEVERRMIPGESAEDCLIEVTEWIQRSIGFEVEHEPPWLTSLPLAPTGNADLGESIAKLVQQSGGPGRQIGVAFGTHASRTARAGVPSVVFGPGDIDQAHTRDEWIDLQQLEDASAILYQYLARS